MVAVIFQITMASHELYEFSADDYREMVEEMDAEEARQACAEEGVHVGGEATLEGLRAALLAHYCEMEEMLAPAPFLGSQLKPPSVERSRPIPK